MLNLPFDPNANRPDPFDLGGARKPPSPPVVKPKPQPDPQPDPSGSDNVPEPTPEPTPTEIETKDTKYLVTTDFLKALKAKNTAKLELNKRYHASDLAYLKTLTDRVQNELGGNESRLPDFERNRLEQLRWTTANLYWYPLLDGHLQNVAHNLEITGSPEQIYHRSFRTKTSLGVIKELEAFPWDLLDVKYKPAVDSSHANDSYEIKSTVYSVLLAKYKAAQIKYVKTNNHDLSSKNGKNLLPSLSVSTKNSAEPAAALVELKNAESALRETGIFDISDSYFKAALQKYLAWAEHDEELDAIVRNKLSADAEIAQAQTQLDALEAEHATESAKLNVLKTAKGVFNSEGFGRTSRSRFTTLIRRARNKVKELTTNRNELRESIADFQGRSNAFDQPLAEAHAKKEDLRQDVVAYLDRDVYNHGENRYQAVNDAFDDYLAFRTRLNSMVDEKTALEIERKKLLDKGANLSYQEGLRLQTVHEGVQALDVDIPKMRTDVDLKKRVVKTLADVEYRLESSDDGFSSIADNDLVTAQKQLHKYLEFKDDDEQAEFYDHNTTMAIFSANRERVKLDDISNNLKTHNEMIQERDDLREHYKITKESIDFINKIHAKYTDIHVASTDRIEKLISMLDLEISGSSDVTPIIPLPEDKISDE